MLKKCNLRILLDQPDGRYRQGDRITGAVELAPLDEITDTVLTLTLQWQTDGRGDRAAGAPQALTLYQGSLPPGRLQRYPFTFDAPAGPFTYHGELLQVRWLLTAHADIPWARDATVQHEILLESSPSSPLAALFPQPPLGDTLDILIEAEPETFQGALAAREQIAQLRQMGSVLFGYGKKIFYFFGGLMVVMGAAALINDPDVGIPLTLFGAVFLGFAHFVFRKFARFEAMRTAPEEAGVTVEPTLLRPGEPVQFTVQLPGGSRVRNATATLQGHEYVSYQIRDSDGDTETQSRTYPVYEQPAPLHPTRRFVGTALQATFQVPSDASPSFNASHNALQWSIAFSVELQGRDHPWHGSAILIVRP